ncbi:MAG: folylpolyglutamate synthase/dihydrofolate synthase family protein [Bacillota bacterium]
MKPGLERTRELLRRLGDPHRAGYRVVHIGGTNGKGSTAAMVAAGLRAAGHRVGLYTSPALQRWNERIQVDGRPIADGEVAALAAEVRPAVEAMVREGYEQPTEFEVTTALAFLHYARQRVDWLVLEVGLGGRYDATNVVEDPAVTCITNVDLDHTEVLGPTHRAIAWDKAGILKPGVPCVTGATHPEALAVLRDEARRVGAPLLEVAPPPGPVAWDLTGQVADLPGLPGARIRLLGRHQLANAACAARILQVLGLPEAPIRRGLAEARWPGRLEVVPGDPPVLLDVAHNPAGAAALAQAVRDYLPGRPVVLVLGLLADKNVDGFLDALLPLARQAVAVTPDHPTRALPARDLAAALARRGVAAAVAPSPEEALRRARALCPAGGAVLVAGSHYLVGPVRSLLVPVE